VNWQVRCDQPTMRRVQGVMFAAAVISIRSCVFYSSKVGSDVNKRTDECGGVCHTSVMNEKLNSSQLICRKLSTSSICANIY
jgi:hypothetical protein